MAMLLFSFLQVRLLYVLGCDISGARADRDLEGNMSKKLVPIHISGVLALLLGVVFNSNPLDNFAFAGKSTYEPAAIPEIQGMVYIPPGEFIMGSTMEDVTNMAQVDEFPQRKVSVDGFYIDIFEVTNVQYKIFVDSMHVDPPSHWVNARYPVGMDGFPVVGVSWYNAKKYDEFMGKRLPTE